MSEDTDVYKRLWTEGGNGDRLTNEFIGRTVCAKWAQQLRSGDADTIGRVADTLEQIADGANPREVLFSKTPHKKIARDMLVATFVNAHLRNTDCSQNEACKHVAYSFGLNWENVERIWERTSHLVIPNETMRGGKGDLTLVWEYLLSEAPAAWGTLYGFTPAETRVCELLYYGHTVKGVAELLELSTNTVRTHLKSIFLKCRVNSQVLRSFVQTGPLAAPDRLRKCERLTPPSMAHKIAPFFPKGPDIDPFTNSSPELSPVLVRIHR